jgi:hypothetical protein
MLGKVVGEIVFTCTPMSNELALLDSVADPVEAHVYGFGSTLFDCFVGDASGACIFGLDGFGWVLQVDGPFLQVQCGGGHSREPCGTRRQVQLLWRMP